MTEISAFIKEKERYLKMPEDEKRKQYTKPFVTLGEIDSWNTYYKNNIDRLQKLDKNEFKSKYSISVPEVRKELNEKVSIWRGDITRLEIDAIVNAANNSLLGGMGVDGEIHRVAGKFLLDECRILSGCDTGDAKITGGYKLPAKYVIHTVGPKGERPQLLESCYSTSMKVLMENNLKTIAFPCISTGVYGYPQDSAASVAIGTVRKILESKSSSVDRVVFCLFLEKDFEIYERMMQLYFPV